MKTSSGHKERSESNGISPKLGGAMGMLREGYPSRAGLTKQGHVFQRDGLNILELQIILYDQIIRYLLGGVVGG